MKKKPFSYIVLIGILLIANSCTSDQPYENLPECVTNQIASENKIVFPVSIYECKLNGEIVYQVEHNQCCDQTSFLFDGQCNQLCEYGGWSGDPCDSVLNALTDKKLIYQSP